MKNRLLLLAATIVVAVAGCITGGPQENTGALRAAVTIDPNATYTIKGTPSGKCVGIAGASLANSASAEIRTCDGSSSQAFRIQTSGAGFYKITNVNSGKCLDVNGNSMANGAHIIQFTCSGASNQQWAVADTTGGSVKLTSHSSSKVIQPNGGASTDGTILVQQTWASLAYQNFLLSTGSGGSGGSGGSAGTGGTGGTAGTGGSGGTATIPSKASIVAAMTLANSYFMAKWPDPGVNIVTDKSRPSNIWTRGVYYEGLMGLQAVDPHQAYYDYAVLWATDHSWNMAYDVATTRVADNQDCGQTYIDLYTVDPQPVRIQNVTISIMNMVNSSISNDWSWIDAIHMAMPDFAKLGATTGNMAYFNKMYAMYSYSKTTYGFYNTTAHLWWRDATFKPPYVEPNGQNLFWSRGNGWVYSALARVLDVLPTSDPHYAEYLADFQAMTPAIVATQRTDGFWNVSLLDPTDFGGPELTGTSLFAYGLAFGIRKGFIDDTTYRPALAKAWAAMASSVHTNGFLGWVQGTGKQPSDGQPVTFDSVPNFEDFGLGCFLLGGSETAKLAQ